MPTKETTKVCPHIDLEHVAEPQYEEPKLYKVVIYNDDYTTQDFVVDILVQIFQKPLREATQIMWQIHSEGAGIAGIFPYDIAENRIKRVQQRARLENFPLRLQCEPA